MESSQDSSDSVTDKLDEQRELRRQQHLESVQIAFMAVIVGSYFTDVGQKFASTSALGTVIDWFVTVSGVFLVLKVAEIVVRVEFPSFHDSVPMEGVSSTLTTLYTVSALGFGLAVVLQLLPFPVRISPLLTYAIVGGLVVVGVGIGIRAFRNRVFGFTTLSKWDSSRGRRETLDAARQFERFVYRYPGVIEEGLEITHTHTNGLISDGNEGRYPVDFLATDAQNRRTGLELKLIKSGKGRNILRQLQRYQDGFDNLDRVILVTNTDVAESVKEELEKQGIEHATVKPYRVFGPFARFVKWIINRAN